jgi:hypothetical protein
MVKKLLNSCFYKASGCSNILLEASSFLGILVKKLIFLVKKLIFLVKKLIYSLNVKHDSK